MGAHISSCGMKNFLIFLKFGQCVTIIYLDDIVRIYHGLKMVFKGTVPRAREMAQQVKGVTTEPYNVEFNPWNSHGRRRQLAPASCPLPHTHALLYKCTHMHTYAHTKTQKLKVQS